MQKITAAVAIGAIFCNAQITALLPQIMYANMKLTPSCLRGFAIGGQLERIGILRLSLTLSLIEQITTTSAHW